MSDEFANKIHLYLAVLSIPTYFNTYLFLGMPMLSGLYQHVLGVFYRKDIRGKNGGDVVTFLKRLASI